jgi:hypothetical protein
MDIWEDLDTLSFLQHGEYPPQVTSNHRITYNNNPNATHGGTITSFDAYDKVTKWFFHHMNGLVLFRKYIRSLDILKLSVFIAFLLLITIRKVCMLKS